MIDVMCLSVCSYCCRCRSAVKPLRFVSAHIRIPRTSPHCYLFSCGRFLEWLAVPQDHFRHDVSGALVSSKGRVQTRIGVTEPLRANVCVNSTMSS